jgi:hypothetical protein
VAQQGLDDFNSGTVVIKVGRKTPPKRVDPDVFQTRREKRSLPSYERRGQSASGVPFEE